MAKQNDGNQNSRTVYVEREPYEKNGKEYYSYFIKGKVRGKDVKVALVPPDNGGYPLLDIVFDGADKAELFETPYEIRDEKTKRVVKGVTYGVRTVDKETGEVFECPIKPYRSSDKTLLNMLLR